MHRFVLLRHECPEGFEKPSHWDFMLERDGVLMTWELRELPAPWAAALGLEYREKTDKVTATRLPDHRLDYLDYEGPLSENRGTVARVAEGNIEIKQLEPALLAARLSSDPLGGAICLRATGTTGQWVLVVDNP